MRNPVPHYWTSFALGRVGFRLAAWNSIQDARSGVALVGEGFGAKRHYCALRGGHDTEIEAKLGPVEWLAPPGQDRWRVRTVHPSMLSDRETWPALNLWFAETLEQWATVLRPLVRTLGASDDQAATETVGAVGVDTGADREDENESYCWPISRGYHYYPLGSYRSPRTKGGGARRATSWVAGRLRPRRWLCPGPATPALVILPGLGRCARCPRRLGRGARRSSPERPVAAHGRCADTSRPVAPGRRLPERVRRPRARDYASREGADRRR